MGYETLHEVDDESKVAKIAASMAKNGWAGAPVVVFGEIQVTGVHRAAAAEEAGIDLETIDFEEVFAEDGADWSEAVERYNEETYVGSGLYEMARLLSAETVTKYGIDIH